MVVFSAAKSAKGHRLDLVPVASSRVVLREGKIPLMQKWAMQHDGLVSFSSDNLLSRSHYGQRRRPEAHILCGCVIDGRWMRQESNSDLQPISTAEEQRRTEKSVREQGEVSSLLQRGEKGELHASWTILYDSVLAI